MTTATAARMGVDLLYTDVTPAAGLEVGRAFLVPPWWHVRPCHDGLFVLLVEPDDLFTSLQNRCHFYKQHVAALCPCLAAQDMGIAQGDAVGSLATDSMVDQHLRKWLSAPPHAADILVATRPNDRGGDGPQWPQRGTGGAVPPDARVAARYATLLYIFAHSREPTHAIRHELFVGLFECDEAALGSANVGAFASGNPLGRRIVADSLRAVSGEYPLTPLSRMFGWVERQLLPRFTSPTPQYDITWDMLRSRKYAEDPVGTMRTALLGADAPHTATLGDLLRGTRVLYVSDRERAAGCAPMRACPLAIYVPVADDVDFECYAYVEFPHVVLFDAGRMESHLLDNATLEELVGQLAPCVLRTVARERAALKLVMWCLPASLHGNHQGAVPVYRPPTTAEAATRIRTRAEALLDAVLAARRRRFASDFLPPSLYVDVLDEQLEVDVAPWDPDDPAPDGPVRAAGFSRPGGSQPIVADVPALVNAGAQQPAAHFERRQPWAVGKIRKLVRHAMGKWIGRAGAGADRPFARAKHTHAAWALASDWQRACARLLRDRDTLTVGGVVLALRGTAVMGTAHCTDRERHIAECELLPAFLRTVHYMLPDTGMRRALLRRLGLHSTDDMLPPIAELDCEFAEIDYARRLVALACDGLLPDISVGAVRAWIWLEGASLLGSSDELGRGIGNARGRAFGAAVGVQRAWYSGPAPPVEVTVISGNGTVDNNVAMERRRDGALITYHVEGDRISGPVCACALGAGAATLERVQREECPDLRCGFVADVWAEALPVFFGADHVRWVGLSPVLDELVEEAYRQWLLRQEGSETLRQAPWHEYPRRLRRAVAYLWTVRAGGEDALVATTLENVALALSLRGRFAAPEEAEETPAFDFRQEFMHLLRRP